MMQHSSDIGFEAARAWLDAGLRTQIFGSESLCAVGAVQVDAATEEAIARRDASQRIERATDWAQLYGLPWHLLAEQARRNDAAVRHLNTLLGALGNVWLCQCRDWMTLWLAHQRAWSAPDGATLHWGPSRRQAPCANSQWRSRSQPPLKQQP